jgi:hypothetical protein
MKGEKALALATAKPRLFSFYDPTLGKNRIKAAYQLLTSFFEHL